jgi:hypothetical protein
VHVFAALAHERQQVADDFHASDPVARLLEVDVLEQELSACHPLVGDDPRGLTGDLPGTDQSAERIHRGRPCAVLVWLTGAGCGAVAAHVRLPFLSAGKRG